MATRKNPGAWEIEVPALRAALGAVIHAAADDSRPILASVYFEFTPRTKKASTLRIVSCDNYRMAIMPMAGDFPAACQSVVIRVEDAAVLLKDLSAKGADGYAAVTFAPEPDGTLRVTVGATVRLLAPIQGQYPNWSAIADPVLKAEAKPPKGTVTIGISPAYLADLAKVGKALGDRYPAVRWTITDPLKPTLTRIAGNRDFYEVIMPVRLADSGKS